jgi:hypothetical protein
MTTGKVRLAISDCRLSMGFSNRHSAFASRQLVAWDPATVAPDIGAASSVAPDYVKEL